MEWLEGKLLKEYIEENLSNKRKLSKLANDFLEMCRTLRENKISHGDLQEGNILIDKNSNIKLVDYDSVCIPEIEGEKELVSGLKGYQHPSRFKGAKASLKADYFSELVIYISILVFSEKSDLWNKYQVKDTQYLIFNESDFEDFENSEVYQDLQKLSQSVKSLTRIVSGYLRESNYRNLTAFENFLIAPKIISFNASKKEILQDKSIEISWNVENEDTISLNNGIGNVIGKKSISISPNQTNKYKLTAENAFGKTEEEITINVLPLPKIKEFRSKQQKIEYGKETQLVWDVENIEKVELHWLGNMEVASNKGEKNITNTEHTNYKLVVTALDGITKEEKEILVQVFKRVEIKYFVSDLQFVIESLPITLTWDTENADKIIIEDNFGTQTDVTTKNTLEVIAKRNTRFFKIFASDPLGNNLEKRIDITVDERQRVNINMPSIELPKLNLSLGQTVIEESSFEFAFTEAKKKHQPLISFKRLLNYLYDK
jgi:serine/threonine protein kinase